MHHNTISEAVKYDHHEVKVFYNTICNSTVENTINKYRNELVWELARHSAAEELVVYPLIEKNLGAEGKQIANKDRQDHTVIKEQLKAIQELPASSPKLLPLLQEMMDKFSSHIKREEQTDLPKLEGTLSPKESLEVAQSFGRTKFFVPSKSHPSAPNKPPFENAVGLLTAPFDRLQNAFESFPSSTPV